MVNYGDWGLGIGPNPQSPIPNPQIYSINLNFNKNLIELIIQSKSNYFNNYNLINYLKAI